MKERPGKTIGTRFPRDLGINHKIVRALVNASRASATTLAERQAAAKARFAFTRKKV